MGRAIPDVRVTFHVEPADRSVGIMAEGFSAWIEGAAMWCELEDIATGKCVWFDNDSNPTHRPRDAAQIEALLVAFAAQFYESES